MTPTDGTIAPTRIREILEAYYSPLPLGIEKKVAKYIDLLALWGRRMSLTAIKDPEEVVRAHFGESIFALSLSSLSEGRLADVGTGAGFPGLALKLTIPELPVALIEPNRKKCAFLNEIVRTLGLSGVEIIPLTFEGTKIEENSLATVTCRALRAEKRLLKWSHRVLKRDGELLLWIGAGDIQRMQGLGGWDWREPELIPGTKGRYILRGKKQVL